MTKRILILAITILFISTAGFSQLVSNGKTAEENTVGEVRALGTLLFKLSYKVIQGDTVYSILYKNQEYQQITDYQIIKYDGADNTNDKLFELLKSFFTDEKKQAPKYEESVTLGETTILISMNKMMGMKYLTLFTKSGYFNINEKQLHKLFAK